MRIYCSIPTPKVGELAKKLGENLSYTNNLVCVWQSINNQPNVVPTEQQIRELMKDNQKEIEASKFAVPYYEVSEEPRTCLYEDGVISRVDNDGKLHIILKLFPEGTNLDEVKEGWTTVPRELLSVITTFRDLYTVELWQTKFMTTDPDFDIENNPNAGVNALIKALKLLKELKDKEVSQQKTEPTNPQVESENKNNPQTTQSTNSSQSQEKTITYTPIGKPKQTYTIRGTQIFNKHGREVFKEDSVDRNRIFANLAVQEGRAVVIEYKDSKYVVNRRGQIISVATGKLMKWEEENGDRKNVLSLANKKFNDRVPSSIAENNTDVYKEGISESNPKEDLPEIGIPEIDTNTIKVNYESPRTKLSRELTPSQIIFRENMIVRDFTKVVNEALEDITDELRGQIEQEKDPLVKLQLSERLNLLNDPIRGRREAISSLGVEEIMSRIKEYYQNWIDLDDNDIESVLVGRSAEYVRDAYQKVLDNFDLLFDGASPLIEQIEHVKISRNSKEEIQDSETDSEIEEEILGDAEEGERINGNEGYTFKVRFVDPYETSRAETRKILGNLKQVDINGNVIQDDLGNVIYVREDYAHTALLSALKDMTGPDDFSIKNSDGSYSLPALERAAEIYPWVNQVINELQANPDLISAFYTDFRKEYISYWMSRDGKMFPMNSEGSIESTMRGIQYNYENGNPQDDDSIFDASLNISTSNISKAQALLKNTQKLLSRAYDNEDMFPIASDITKLLKILGFNEYNLNLQALKDISNKELAFNILNQIENALEISSELKKGEHYADSIKEPLGSIARLLGKVTELDAKVVFRQGKNTYPSYAAPNYIETLFKKILNRDINRRVAFLEEEFGKYDWFKHNGVWQNEILKLISSDENVVDNIGLINMFNIDGVEYSRWTPKMINKAVLEAYFYTSEDPEQLHQYGMYNFPIFADSKMMTLVKFIKYTGDYKSQLLPLYRRLVWQELRRIKLVQDRAKNNIPKISNFDKRGLEFCFLPELNTIKLSYKGQSTLLLDIIQDLKKSGDIDSINNYIDRAIENVISTHADNFILNNESTIHTEEFIDFIRQRTNIISEDAVLDKVREFVWNQIFVSSQLVQLVTTDLAYYSNEVDFQKRFKEVYAAGTKLNTNSKYGRKVERTVYLRDRIVTSPTYSSLQNLLRDAVNNGNLTELDYDFILSNFKNINAVDGQAYRSLSSYRSIMDMLGRWTSEMEKAFNRLQSGEFDISDFTIVWQTIKPFVYGQVDTPDGLSGRIKVPHQNKNSEFLLLATYQTLGTMLTKSPQLRGLSKFMENHNIDVVQFESAVKVGGSGIIDINVSPEAIKDAEKGYIEIKGNRYKMPNLEGKSLSNSIDTIKKEYDELLDKKAITQDVYNEVMNYFTPSEQEVINILESCTLNKVSDSDIIEEGYNTTTVHSISYDDYMIAQPTPEHLFDVKAVFGSQFRNLIYADLPEDIEITIGDKTIQGRDNIQKYYFSLIVENLLDSYVGLNNTFSSIESLQQRLLSIVKGNPKYGRDLINALEIVEVEGRKVFNVPFSDKITSTRLEELITSIFRNSISKQDIKGAACILTSNFGFTDRLKIERDSDGRVEYVECYLPAYSKQFYEDFLVPVVNSIGKTIGYEIDYNKLKEEDSSLLDFVGYRIPTEAKYSMLPLRIKGFLPQQNGSAIMLPAEITTLSGSDFDVDKLFMILPEFKKVNGKYKVIKYDHSKAPEDNSRKQRNNEILQIALQILTNKDVNVDSQRPGNFNTLKHQARINDITSNYKYCIEWMNSHKINNVEDLVNSLLNASLSELTDFLNKVKPVRNPLTTETFAYFHRQNMTGKALVGIYANNNTMQAKFQGKGLSLKDGFEFTVDDKVIKNLSSIFTKEGNNLVRISKNCSEFSAASVDNVKDPVLASLMQNTDTASISCFMLRAGMSIPEIGAFFNIPIVRDTIIKDGNINNLEDNISFLENTVANLLQRRHFEVRPLLSISLTEVMNNTINVRRLQGLSSEELNNVDKKEIIDTLSKEARLAKTFSIIASYAEALNETVMSYRADSPNGSIKRSVAMAKIQSANIDRLLEKSLQPDYPLSGIYNIIRNDYITPDMTIDEMRNKLMESNIPLLQSFYSLGIDFGVKTLSNYFAYAGEYIDNIIDEVSVNSKRPLTATDVQIIYNAAMQFALSGTPLFGDTEDMSLEEKREYYLTVFPSEFNKIKHDNPDIAELPIIKKLSTTSKGIIMRESSRNSAALREILMNSMDNLLYMENPEAQKLAAKLFAYAYFKEGLSFGPNSFSQYFSSLFKTSFQEYISVLRELPNTMGIDERWNRFLPQLYANNSKFASTISIPKEYYSDNESLLSIPFNQVISSNLVAPTALKFIQDASTKKVYKLNESTAGSDIVQYTVVPLAPGNLYNMNSDVEDMISRYNEFIKAGNKINENQKQEDRERWNQAVNPDNVSSIESNPEITDSEVEKGDIVLTDIGILDNIDEALENLEEYDPTEGLDIEGIIPC